MKTRNLFILLFLLIQTLDVVGQKGELIIRQGHREVINMVRYMPSGDFIVTASDDGMLKAWDVNTGIDVKTFIGHQSGVKSFVISEDGSKILSGDKAGVINLWNVDSPSEPIRSIDAHNGAVNVIKIDPNKSSFWTGGDDKLLKQWSLDSFELLQTVSELTGEVRSIGISPDGKRIVLGGQRANDVELLLINAENGQILDDALKHIKGAGAAKAFTAAVLGGVAVATSVAKGDVDKDMMNFYVFDYSNIEFRKDGRTALISQNLYLPLFAAKEDEEREGGSIVIMAEFNEDLTQFANVKNLKKWHIDYPRTRAIFNEDQTKIITNIKHSINIYDVENAEFPRDQKENPNYEPPKLKEFTGDLEWLTSVDISPDYRSVVSASEDRKLDLWDIESGQRVRRLEGFIQPALAVEPMPDGEHIVVGSYGKRMAMWNIKTGQLVKVFERSYSVDHIDVSDDGKYMVTTSPNTKFFKLWNVRSGNIVGTYIEKSDNIVWVKFDSDPEYILAATETGELKRWSRSEKKIKKRLKENYADYDKRRTSNGSKIQIAGDRLEITGTNTLDDTQSIDITDAVFGMDGTKVFTTNMLGEVSIYSIESGEKLASLALVDDQDYVAYTPDYFYTSSKGASKALAFKSDMGFVPFEQMELKLNRPDKVVERLGMASEKLVLSYKMAYEKRLTRLGFNENDIASTPSIPKVDIDISNLPLATTDRSFGLDISASDPSYNLSRLNVYVNEVPAYGINGIDISGNNSTSFEDNISIDLSSGVNTVKVSVTNAKGFESTPESFQITYDGGYAKQDLYILSIGVSKYETPGKDLHFAAKDARDFINVFSGSQVFGNINHKILTDADASSQNILAAKEFLDQAKLDDVVMIFIAGHGVLDSKYDYYFATSTMNFENPSEGGLAYTDLENLLGGLTSRNKLLIMDTCFSGELDKDEVEEVNSTKQRTGSVNFRSAGTALQYKEGSFGLSNSLELSKTLFGDLKKGTGATVISAAGGVEFAREGMNSDNGLFTSCLLEGIKTRRADLNRDRKYTVSELRQYVFQRVTDISNGEQVPTSREENLLNDFRVY